MVKFYQSNHKAWFALSVCTIIGPYLIAYCSLNAYFQYREVFVGSKTLQLLGLFFMGPMCIVYFFLMDVLFMIQTIVNDVFSLLFMREFRSTE
eukprot:UN24388